MKIKKLALIIASTLLTVTCALGVMFAMPDASQTPTVVSAEATNVANNGTISIKSYDMSRDLSLSYTNPTAIPEGTQVDVNRIKDNDFNYVYALQTAEVGWAVIDFGAVYYIDYVVYDAYWDWGNGNNIIELATMADFSDSIRIFDCPTDIHTGVAVDANGQELKVENTDIWLHSGTGLKIPAGVNAQYIRVTNNKEKKYNFSVFTEIQAFTGTEGVSTYEGNVAWGKPISVKSMDMSEDWTNDLYAFNKSGELGANTATKINDNSYDFWYTITTKNQNACGWAIIDLLAPYYIDYICYDAYWDWWMGSNVIQIANQSDFSDAITVFNYRNGVRTGDADGDGVLVDHKTNPTYTGLKVDVNLTGRYIRVTNNRENLGQYSAFTEIKVISSTSPAASASGTNVALNKPISVKSMDMSEDWTNNLYAINKPNEEGANTANHINDGSFDIWYPVSTLNCAIEANNYNAQAWAVIDFGAVYYIDYVVYEAYWDWWVNDSVIQLATRADFSDAVTIYNEPNGIQTGVASEQLGMQIDANTYGRYIRVTNTIGYKNAEGVDVVKSVFNEIQAYAADIPTVASVDTSSIDSLYSISSLKNVVDQMPTSLNVLLADGTQTTVQAEFLWLDDFDVEKGGVYRAMLLPTVPIYGALNSSNPCIITVKHFSETVSLTIDDGLPFNYYVSPPEMDGLKYTTTMSFMGQNYVVEGDSLDDGRQKFVFDHIRPHHMTEKIIISLTVMDKNENVLVASENTMTVQEYCETLLASLSADSKAKTNLDELLISILNYGAAAQVYMNHDTENLVNAGLEDSLKTVDTEKLVENAANVLGGSGYSQNIAGENKVWFAAATVILQDKIAMRAKLSVDDFTNETTGVTVTGAEYAAGLTATVSIGTGEAKAVDIQGSNGTYYLYLYDIMPTQYDETITFTVYKDGNAIATLTYSVNSYVARKYNEKSGEAYTTNALVTQALWAYGYYANEYAKEGAV